MEYHKDADTDEEKLVNVAYFIGDDGEILGRYQKKNLWYTYFSLEEPRTKLALLGLTNETADFCDVLPSSLIGILNAHTSPPALTPLTP